jgi:hypothetical protein
MVALAIQVGFELSFDWRNGGVSNPGTGTVTFNGAMNQIQNTIKNIMT